MVYHNNTSIIWCIVIILKKMKKWREMPTWIFVPGGLWLVSNLQIGEIACKFEIGELVSKIGGKIWTRKFTNLLANLGLRGHSIPLSEGLEILPWSCQFRNDCDQHWGGGKIKNRRGKILGARSCHITTLSFELWGRVFLLEFSERKNTGGNSWAGPPTFDPVLPAGTKNSCPVGFLR